MASYVVAGSRFFELKTVQKLDGEDLPVSKPCIKADDECYNCEWSTELYVPQAFDEYVKAWFYLQGAGQEFGLAVLRASSSTCPWDMTWTASRQRKLTVSIEGMKDAS